MQKFGKLLLGVVVLFAVVVPMFLKGPDGRPILDPTEWLPDDERVSGYLREAGRAAKDLAGDSARSLSDRQTGDDSDASRVREVREQEQSGAETLSEDAPTRLTGDSGKMYKWQDAQGRWHFSNEKPTHSEGVAMDDLPQVENVMEAPVDRESEGSMMGLPGVGDAGEILEKVRRMAAERDQ